MIGTPSTPTCATPYCGCGRCYSPGSLVGDWLRRRLTGALRSLRSAVLRRPHRYQYGADGGLVLPAWVAGMWQGELADEERRPGR